MPYDMKMYQVDTNIFLKIPRFNGMSYEEKSGVFLLNSCLMPENKNKIFRIKKTPDFIHSFVIC
jgi:hypothetical protein